jgi:hypothetical protein
MHPKSVNCRCDQPKDEDIIAGEHYVQISWQPFLPKWNENSPLGNPGHGKVAFKWFDGRPHRWSFLPIPPPVHSRRFAAVFHALRSHQVFYLLEGLAERFRRLQGQIVEVDDPAVGLPQGPFCQVAPHGKRLDHLGVPWIRCNPGGSSFDSIGLAIEAAAAGLGFAMAIEAMLPPDLARRKVVVSRGPPIRTKLDRARVDCATSNVNANIRGRLRTTAHVSGALNTSGHQGRRGNFRECASDSEA